MFMEKELSIETIKTFNIDGIESPVSFVETMQVADGVKCDTYTFDNRDDVDLGIIKIQPNFKTPRQKVLDGENTVEGYISGKGKLVVERNYGHTDVYDTGTNGKIKVTMNEDIIKNPWNLLDITCLSLLKSQWRDCEKKSVNKILL